MHFAVTAIGVDRPGIVAGVTGALMAHGCNLEDSSMTILRDQFAILLIVEARSQAAEELEATMAPVCAEFGLTASVRPVAATPALAQPEDEPRWTVTVHGADRPGIVHSVTRLLAGRGVNIVDLTTRVIGPATAPVYAMVLDVTLPAGVDADSLGADLGRLAAEIGVDCRLHATEPDIL